MTFENKSPLDTSKPIKTAKMINNFICFIFIFPPF
jgi:hypothetical protein